MIHRAVGLRTLLVVLGLAIAGGAGAEDADGPIGGHPLNRGAKRPTLEDLLDAPDWEPARGSPSASPPPTATTPTVPRDAGPVARPVPQDESAGGVAARPLVELIDDRHRIIDQGQVYKRLDAINRNPKALDDNDTQNLRNWIACYQEMRAFLRPDRGDPDMRPVLEALEKATGRRKDFYEGRALAALCRVYQGDEAKALDHLKRACEGLKKHQLYWTVFAQDCCHAYLLLNRPAEVKPFVDALRKLTKQTAVRCWLVATYEVLLCHDGEAGKFFDRALTIAGMPSVDRLPVGADPLLGDSAMFFLTASVAAKRDATRARELLDTARDSRDWRVLRARAALEADNGNWDAAIGLIDECAGIAPLTLAGEIRAQRDAYATRKPWFRPRPEKR